MTEQLREVLDDEVGARLRSSSGPVPRSTPITSAKPPATADWTPLMASSTATLRAGSTPSIRAASTNTSGAGLDARWSRSAITPSITTRKRSRRPAVCSTSSAFFELETTAVGMPAASSSSSSATDPGYGAMPSARSTRENTSFLRLPMPHTVSAVTRIGRLTPRHLDVAAAQQARDTVVPLLAVEVVEVVALRVGRLDVPGSEKLLEHRLPRVHVHLGGRREHAVQIEQDGIVRSQVGQGIRGHVTSRRGAGSAGERLVVAPLLQA